MWQLAWWWILLALPIPWFVRRWSRPDPIDRDAALKVPDPDEFVGLTGSGDGSGHAARRLLLLWGIWTLVLLAAARPQYVGEPTALPVTGRDLLIAVDLSGSMEEQDFQLGGEWVDRLTATKAVAREFIDRRVGGYRRSSVMKSAGSPTASATSFSDLPGDTGKRKRIPTGRLPCFYCRRT